MESNLGLTTEENRMTEYVETRTTVWQSSKYHLLITVNVIAEINNIGMTPSDFNRNLSNMKIFVVLMVGIIIAKSRALHTTSHHIIPLLGFNVSCQCWLWLPTSPSQEDSCQATSTATTTTTISPNSPATNSPQTHLPKAKKIAGVEVNNRKLDPCHECPI